jgi:RimJ/RimL family protein N-acetyltransferase
MNQAIVQRECRESIYESGVVLRNVYPLVLTQENLALFWDKAKHYPVLFCDEIRGDFQKFLETFLTQDANGNVHPRGLLWVIDDFIGVFYMTDIKQTEATVHFSFFDAKLQGRGPLIKDMLRYAFARYGFRRMNVEIPLYANDKIGNFIEMIGFKEEGRKRKAILFDNELFDVKLYGILKEEVAGWV